MSVIDNNPLVSIVIVTYNSSLYIYELLKSVKDQSYLNIELIISDDCSIDSTFEICEAWVADNKNRFVNIVLTSTTRNQGVSANCNNGLSYCSGSWVKFIGGDDILDNCAIQNYVDYVFSQKTTDIVFGDVVKFINSPEDSYSRTRLKNLEHVFFLQDSLRQHQILLRLNFLPAPSSFISKTVFDTIGGFDEEFPMIEDYPFWLKATEKGIHISYLNKVTVFYRRNPASITKNHGDGSVINKSHTVHSDYLTQHLRSGKTDFVGHLLINYDLIIRRLIIMAGNKKKSFLCRLLFIIYKITFINRIYLYYLYKKNFVMSFSNKKNSHIC